MIKSLLVFLLLGPVSAFALTPSPQIREAAIRAHIKFLADDLLEGRGTGSRGGEIAARYIASQLSALGLTGAGHEGSFFQPVSLVGVKADPKTLLKVSGGGHRETFHFGEDFVAFTGAQRAEVSADADLVFVGYGIDSPAEKWNDYSGPASDYQGKILVILVNDPPPTSDEPNRFGGKALTYQGRWTYKFEEAARRGAVGAILLHTDESAGYPWSVVRTSNGSWRFDLARSESDPSPSLAVRAWMTDAAARKVMKLAGQDLAELRHQAASRNFKPIALKLKAEIDLKSELTRVEASNVAGILEGTDKNLKKKYLVLSAHSDHLGIGEPDKTGDRIYNGAVDNASGTAGILELAAYFTSLPKARRPRRSLLFLFPTAEEQGLLGSEWYVSHPLVPLTDTVADLNLDGLNTLGLTRDLIPLGAERSLLKSWVEEVARDQKITLSPEPRPEQGTFFRSDHFPFAKAGVPALSLESGDDYVGRAKNWGAEQFRLFNEQHYHQPSDEYQANWDLKGAIQEENFLASLALRLANTEKLQK